MSAANPVADLPRYSVALVTFTVLPPTVSIPLLADPLTAVRAPTNSTSVAAPVASLSMVSRVAARGPSAALVAYTSRVWPVRKASKPTTLPLRRTTVVLLVLRLRPPTISDKLGALPDIALSPPTN